MSAARVIASLLGRLPLLRRLFAALFGLVAVADILLPREAGAHYLMDRLPLFWTGFGLAGAVLLALVGKGVVKPLLHRDGDDHE